jgi:glycosyltransferase involved in cell wall biosynthesis
MNLPVDVDFFYPEKQRPPLLGSNSNRAVTRLKLGIAENELVCVYSGKFTNDKNALVLAHAVEKLRDNGMPIRGVFIGGGEQQALIEQCSSCLVFPFMPIKELGQYYRAADIGVWMNESISFLDAACCGLPLLLSDTVKDISHVQEFTAVYRTDDAASLASQIMVLADPIERKRRSELASCLGFERFSGEVYAERRLVQFRETLGYSATMST